MAAATVLVPERMVEAGAAAFYANLEPFEAPATIQEAGVLVCDELMTLHNGAPDSKIINDTLDLLEFYFLMETPAPHPKEIPHGIKSFVASTLETLVNRGHLAEHFAMQYIGVLGLTQAVQQNALARAR